MESASRGSSLESLVDEDANRDMSWLAKFKSDCPICYTGNNWNFFKNGLLTVTQKDQLLVDWGADSCRVWQNKPCLCTAQNFLILCIAFQIEYMLLFLDWRENRSLYYRSNSLVHPISLCFLTKNPVSNQLGLAECLIPGVCSVICMVC